MTDEEMAEKSFIDKGLTYKLCRDKGSYIEGFLDGLKAGSQLDRIWHEYDAGEDCYEDTHEGRWIKRKTEKPNWHILRKNPNDLPEPYMNIVNQDGKKVLYDYKCKVWRNDDADEYICDTPIAWCEIPLFEVFEEESK